MFSTSTLRLLQILPTRQPLLLSSAWLRARCYTPLRPPRPTTSAPSGLPQRSDSWGILGGYVNQKDSQEDTRSVDERWEKRSAIAKQDLLQNPPANPYSGRSVHVTGGNVAEAYRRLTNILQRNKVRPQLRLAERHEKKGEKRRRLSSERWRKRFAHEVRKKVQLVTKIRNRGA